MRKALIAVSGISFVALCPPRVMELHRLAQQRVDNLEHPTERLQEAPSPTDAALDALAQADVAFRKTPVIGPALSTAMDIYITGILTWDILMLSLAAAQRAKKKSIRPDQLWRELNDRGITGKNLRVGIVDGGFFPTDTVPNDKARFFKAATLERMAALYDGDEDGHGAMMMNLIAQACPDATFTAVGFMTPELWASMRKDIDTFFEHGRKNPEILKLSTLRALHRPLMENIALGVRKAVEDGASVVNVSLGLDEMIDKRLWAKLAENVSAIKRLSKTKSAGEPLSPEMQKQLEALNAFGDRLYNLLLENVLKTDLDESHKRFYKPWVEALDFAHQRNTLVVVAAGNTGGAKNAWGKSLEQINPLGMVNHPALIMVGSANSRGEVDDFSNEGNDDWHPWIAANGSGELTAIVSLPKRPWAERVFRPFRGWVQLWKIQHPKGTSLSAPDMCATVLKMMEVNPRLKPGEIKEILATTAGKASFSHKLGKQVSDEIHRSLLLNRYLRGLLDKNDRDALNNLSKLDGAQKAVLLKAFEESENIQIDPAEVERALEASLKRRVGHGVVNRLAAVEEAERRFQAQG